MAAVAGMVLVSASPASAEEKVPLFKERGAGTGQAPYRYQAGADFSIDSGDYGTGSNTTLTYIPFTFKRLWNRGDLSLTIPFESITTDGQVTVVNGKPTPNQPATRTATTERVTHSGLGDMSLKGRYYVLDDQGSVPSVAATARIKFPTADKDKNLGTGEFDEGLGLELSKSFTEKILGMLDVGYTFIGNPPGQNYRNIWNFDFGPGYRFTHALTGSVYYEESRALVAGDSNPEDLLFWLDYKLTQAIRLGSGVTIGLSDGAPDIGFDFGGRVRF